MTEPAGPRERSVASRRAFNDVFWAMTLFIVAVLPIVFLLKRTPLEREHSRRAEPAGSHAG